MNKKLKKNDSNLLKKMKKNDKIYEKNEKKKTKIMKKNEKKRKNLINLVTFQNCNLPQNKKFRFLKKKHKNK